MSSSTLADAWLRLWSPTINFPGSGSIGRFNYHPNTSWDASLYRGDQNVEQLVYRDVASPGRQLGKLTEVILELADALAKIDSDIAASTHVAELRGMADHVEEIKQAVKTSAEDAAREALEKLKALDQKKFDDLIKQCGEQK
jgi:hypothetical protein